MRDIVSVKDFGAVSDGATNDLTAVNAGIAAVPQSELRVPADTYIGTAMTTTPSGAAFTGPGLVKYTPSAVLGSRAQNPAGRSGLSWGAEYLYKWLVKISAGTAATVRMTGDSTTAGGYSTQLQSLLASFSGVTVTIAGQSGKHTGDWLTTYLAADIAAAPDVLIWHWGMNDCSGLGRTLAQFEADLRAGLTSYRASVPIGTGGIILMTPNASSDGTNGRDEVRSERMRRIIAAAARDFKCAYFDTYGFWQDGYVGIGTWLDDTYGDGLRGVHPQTAFSQAIAGEVFNLLAPSGLRALTIGYGISNASGAEAGLLPTAPLSSYPAGLSVRRAQSANGWPLDGWVITNRENSVSTSCIQTLYQYNVDYAPMVRTCISSGAWGAWRRVGPTKVIDSASTVSATVAANTSYQWFETNTGGAAFAVTLPAPVDNDTLTLAFNSATGALTFTPTAPATNVTRLPTAALPAKGSVRMIYNAANTSWYPAPCSPWPSRGRRTRARARWTTA
jgi:hypothetical protein